MRLTAPVLAACLILLAGLAGAHAHDGHDHDEAPSAVGAGSPRLALQSERYELVGILKAGRLILYLDRYEDNAPVTAAAITATLGEDEVAAERRQDGTYAVRSPRLSGHGALEIVVAISAPGGDDLLIGTLNLPAAAGAVVPVDEPRGRLIGTVSSLWPFGLAGATLLFGLVLGRGTRPRSPRAAAPLLAALLAILASHDGARAHEGHDHGPQAASVSDAPQRLPDGQVFLPKPSQRLLEVRTRVAAPETAQRGFRLIGRIIADPNSSGLAQSINGGRLSAPAAGLPRLGQAVRKGDVLATVEPALPQADRTTIAEKAGEIEQLIAIAETKLRRLRGLADANVAPRTQVIDAETELEGLRRRRDIVRQVRLEPETLRAPVDGVIAAAKAVAGQVVGPQDVVFQVVDPNALWVEALSYGDVDPSRIGEASGLLADGTALRLRVQGFSRALQQQATVIHFAISDPPRGASVGQPLAVLVRDGAAASGIILPREAVVRSANGEAIVWLHVAPERFEGRPVRIEPFDAGRVVVRDGVKPGERVVVGGAELVNQVR